MYIKTHDVSIEATVVVRAQQIFDRWQRTGAVTNFESALAFELATPLDPFLSSERHRVAVRRVAMAIQRGLGNGFSDRDTLLEIAQDTIQHN